MLPGPVKLHVTEAAPAIEKACEPPITTLAELGLTVRVGVGVGTGVPLLLLPPPQATKPISTRQITIVEAILVITKLHPLHKEIPLSIGRVDAKYRILRDVRLVIPSRRPKVIRIVKNLRNRPKAPKLPGFARFENCCGNWLLFRLAAGFQFWQASGAFGDFGNSSYPMSSLKFSR